MAFLGVAKLSIDPTKVPSTQTNVPVLVSFTSTFLKLVSSGGLVQSSTGNDIRAFSDAALRTAIAFQKVGYDGSAGTIEFWVFLASVSSSVATTFYLGFGDVKLTADISSTSVWDSDYQGVYHGGDGTTLSVADSTSNAANGTNSGTTAIAGKPGMGALHFDSTDYVSLPKFNNLLGTQHYTLELWLKTTSTTPQFGRVLGWYDGNSASVAEISMNGQAGANNQELDFGNFTDNSGSEFNRTGSSAITAGTWAHIFVMYDGTLIGSTNRLKVQINGVAATLTEQSALHPMPATTKSSMTNSPEIGGIHNTGSFYINGDYDEIRYSKVTRSADYGIFCYNNQSNPSAGGFYSQITIGRNLLVSSLLRMH